METVDQVGRDKHSEVQRAQSLPLGTHFFWLDSDNAAHSRLDRLGAAVILRSGCGASNEIALQREEVAVKDAHYHRVAS